MTWPLRNPPRSRQVCRDHPSEEGTGIAFSAIEIDGCSHSGKGNYDLHRQREIESLGVTVLRFDDVDVKKDMEAVLELIREQVLKMEQR